MAHAALDGGNGGAVAAVAQDVVEAERGAVSSATLLLADRAQPFDLRLKLSLLRQKMGLIVLPARLDSGEDRLRLGGCRLTFLGLLEGSEESIFAGL